MLDIALDDLPTNFSLLFIISAAPSCAGIVADLSITGQLERVDDPVRILHVLIRHRHIHKCNIWGQAARKPPKPLITPVGSQFPARLQFVEKNDQLFVQINFSGVLRL